MEVINNTIISFIISQPNMCYVYSKEPSQWDVFEHQKYMLKLINR